MKKLILLLSIFISMALTAQKTGTYAKEALGHVSTKYIISDSTLTVQNGNNKRLYRQVATYMHSVVYKDYIGDKITVKFRYDGDIEINKIIYKRRVGK